MNSAVYVSINPNAVEKIKNASKNYEFRNYLPKKEFKYLYVYVTAPISELKYIIEIDKIIERPYQISSIGDGNKEFNDGIKSRYAYHISQVIQLEKGIHLKELKEKFSFIPPQAFAYDTKYLKLTDYIKKMDKKIIL